MAMTEAQILEVRSLIPDDSSDTALRLFSDEALQAIYAGSGKESTIRTVAWACFAMGGSDLRVLSAIKNDEIETHGDRTAAEWRLRAKQYFDMANDEDGSEDYFDLVQPDPEACRSVEAMERFPFPWQPPWG